MTTQISASPPVGVRAGHAINMTVRGGAWREDVWDRIGRMRDSVASLDEPGKSHVLSHLKEAETFANVPWRSWTGRRGSHIEAVWRELRLAEEAFLEGVPDAVFRVHAADALDHGVRFLGQRNSQVRQLATELENQVQGAPPGAPLRAQALLVLRQAHQASDTDHRRLRVLGERMTAWVWGLALLALGLVVAVRLLEWEFLPPVASDGTVIAGWQVVVLAMVSGLVGALFTAIPSISLIPDTKEPFNPVRSQAALKMVIGAWSGFIGLVPVTAGLTTEATGTATLAGFVMVAALFGAGQEAVTRFADRKATTVRDAPEGAAAKAKA